jgi:hypothetical protein
VAHALAPDDAAGNQLAVLVDGRFAATDTLVFGIVRVDVLDRTVDPLTELTVAFRILSPIVDGFGFRNFAVAPIQDVFRAGDR